MRNVEYRIVGTKRFAKHVTLWFSTLVAAVMLIGVLGTVQSLLTDRQALTDPFTVVPHPSRTNISEGEKGEGEMCVREREG